MYEALQKHFAEMKIRKVVIYGYKEQRHTHYWVQSAFYRAFSYLRNTGIPFELSWEDNRSLLSAEDLEDALVIGNLNVGHVDFALPLTGNAYYIIHNHAPKRFDARRYRPLKDAGRCITFEVFRGKIYDETHLPVEGEPCHALSVSQSNAVLTWGTDLLPDEIEANRLNVLKARERTRKDHPVVFVGSIWRVNKEALAEVIDYCTSNELSFAQYGGYVADDFRPVPHPDVSFQKEYVDIETNANLVREAYIAPAIQGKSQLSNPESVGNYVPCRVFKNISYGNFGVTNNATANELFDNRLIYHPEIPELMKLAEMRLNDADADETLLDLMDEVKTKHTYINRIETLLNALDACRRAKASTTHDRYRAPSLSNFARRSAAAATKFFTSEKKDP